MKVIELKEFLNTVPDDMEIIVDRFSDHILLSKPEIIKAVRKNEWVMRSHSTMSEENTENEKEYLYFN